MGLFDVFHTRKKPRGPSRPASEVKARAEARDKLEQLRFLRDLKSRDPRLYEEIMLKRMGLGDDRDELSTTLKTLSQLRDAGLVDDPKDAGSRAWLRDLAPAIPGLIQGLSGLAAQASPRPAPAAPPSPPPQPEPAPAAPVEPVEVSLVSRQLIGILEPMTPTQAAEWLTSQKAPFAIGFVEQIVQTPDERIPELMAGIAQEVPDVAGLIAWMRARPAWTMEFVREVRRLQAQPSARSLGV